MSCIDVQIRWLIRRDMPDVLMIERACFPDPWTDEDFMVCLRQRNCIGMVAEYKHSILGFMVYELEKSELRILNFGVHPENQRCGIGRQMIDKLIDKLSQQRRSRIWAEVRERNMDAQFFFREMKFDAVSIIRGYYENTDEDCYVMRYTLDPEELAAMKSPFHPRNRISEFISE